MRRQLLALTLAGMASSSAVSVETCVTPVADGFVAASGLALDGDRLIVTDLGTGKVIGIGADGSRTQIGQTLPHGTDVLGEPTGPYHVAVAGGRVLLAQGWTPAEAKETPLDHAVLELGPDGRWLVHSAEFWNPFAFAGDGERLIVVDSGRNALMTLADDGTLSELHAFPRVSHDETALKALSPTEFTAGEAYEVDAVPTGVEVRGDRIHVALFGGFPFIEKGGAVVSLDRDAPGAAPREEAVGLDAPVDITFDKAGRLVVLEHGLFDAASGSRLGTGRLIAISTEGGAPEVLADGLSRPAKVIADGADFLVSQLAGPVVRIGSCTEGRQ